ncbi:MAG: universal stress protein [Fimbriimonadaceae bacterium]|nr:universal stress protein [Fimbriimonadaceae bacterium]
MKCAVGVDFRGLYERGAAIVTRLAPVDLQTTLVHVVEPAVSEGLPGLTPGHPLYDLTSSFVQDAEHHNDEAAAKLGASMAVREKVVLLGDPGTELAQYADEKEISLVVLGAEKKGFLANLFLGSVTRYLAVHCPTSVLVGKGDIKPGPLRVVWATDLSAYNAACARQFVSWGPTGVGEVHLLHALTDADLDARQEIEDFKGLFSDLGCPVTSSLVDHQLSQAVREAMGPGDLLVVGAAGHSFIERALLGSVSFNEVAHTEHNVLVMRVPGASV